MSTVKKVVITSANCVTARLLIPQLKASGYYTIGLVRKHSLIDTDEVISDWMQSLKAKEALLSADYIIHLSGEINSKDKHIYIESNYTTTKLVADSARNGKARRVIFLSYPDAAATQPNLYLRYKGEAEKLLLNTGKEAVIFRCPVIIDAPDKPSRIDTLFIAHKGKGVPVIGNGEQLMHPVYRGDVAAAVCSALENGGAGVYELSGPEEMSINAFIRLVNNNPAVKIAHTPAWLARLLSRFVKGLSPTFVDIMLHHTNSSYVQATYETFNIRPTAIIRLWDGKR